MKHFLRGELTHENKVNVGINYAKIQKGKLLSKLFSHEETAMTIAKAEFFKDTRRTEQIHERLKARLNKN